MGQPLRGEAAIRLQLVTLKFKRSDVTAGFVLLVGAGLPR